MLWIKVTQDGRRFEKISLGDALTLQIGDDSFELKRGVKRGGNGTVFEAYWYRNSHFEKPVAVKMLGRLDDTRRDRFVNEVRVMKSVKHVSLSYMYADGTHQTAKHALPWAAMELGGDSLRDDIHKNGPLTAEDG